VRTPPGSAIWRIPPSSSTTVVVVRQAGVGLQSLVPTVVGRTVVRVWPSGSNVERLMKSSAPRLVPLAASIARRGSALETWLPAVS
jgi:hypothetical protein